MKYLTLTALTATLLSATPAMAVLDSVYNDGDLLLGFKNSGGTGAATNIVVNLGAATIYRDTTTNLLNIGTIGSLLSSTYGGAAWYDVTTLYMGVVGANNSNPIDNSGNVTLGTDPNSTAYVTARRTALGTAGTASSIRPGNGVTLSGSVQPAAQKIDDMGAYFSSLQSAGIGQLDNANAQSWGANTTASTATDFGGFFNVERGFAAGSFGTFGAAGAIENALDLYRVPEYANGTNAPGASGVGVYLGTFAINTAGDISYIVAAVPEPSVMVSLVVGMLGLATRRMRSTKMV